MFEGGEEESSATPRFMRRGSALNELGFQNKKSLNLADKVTDCIQKIALVKDLIGKAQKLAAESCGNSEV